jgi:hypothetical protein
MSHAAAEAVKENMRKDMGIQLQEYQKELDRERRKREEQIKYDLISIQPHLVFNVYMCYEFHIS